MALMLWFAVDSPCSRTAPADIIGDDRGIQFVGQAVLRLTFGLFPAGKGI